MPNKVHHIKSSSLPLHLVGQKQQVYEKSMNLIKVSNLGLDNRTIYAMHNVIGGQETIG